MGAVLHTLNIRLFPEQLTYVVNHAEDQVVIVDDSAGAAARQGRARPRRRSSTFIVVGERRRRRARGGDRRADRCATRTLLAAESPGFDWPEVDERAAAAMCYTSGTTGNPKGVVYSHRSTVPALVRRDAAERASALTEPDRVLPIVPMFHANAWGLPYAAWLVGARLR